MDRNIYLNSLNFEDALLRLREEFASSSERGEEGSEVIPVTECLGRITAAPVIALLSNPNHNAAAMDGIAVTSGATVGADSRNPLELRSPGDFSWIDTGDVIPPGRDAVIMIEDLLESEDERVVVTSPAHPWQHVRPVGEDVVAGEMIVPSLHRIRPVDIGAIIGGGIRNIEVIKKPVLGIIPTGTEIIESPDHMKPGAILDSNSFMFSAMAAEYGAEPRRYPPVEDDYDSLKAAVRAALDECDMVVIGAGSSAGSEDYSRALIEDLGELLFHGVSIKPGKPAIFGRSAGKPLICIPGYPVSAWIVFDRLVQPLIRSRSGLTAPEAVTVKGTLTRPLVSSLKHLEFVRVKCGRVGEKVVVSPLSRGAGITMSLVQADAIVEVPREYEGYEAGEEVVLNLIKPWKTIAGRLVSIGSHDILMDILAELLKHRGTGSGLSSTHSGSMGGVMAVKRGECHLAPVHILDPETGLYNNHLLDLYLEDEDVILVKGIRRVQGFMVPRGNPDGIKGVMDLVRPEMTFVNRQRGAGTRILLDYLCMNEKIDTAEISGYEREMTTHMTVAQAVQSGSARVGMGVASAANIMGLDFVPVAEEEYDFLFRRDTFNSTEGQTFIELLQSPEFAAELEKLGGYRLQDPGRVAAGGGKL